MISLINILIVEMWYELVQATQLLLLNEKKFDRLV